jgi:hypothetical protein
MISVIENRISTLMPTAFICSLGKKEKQVNLQISVYDRMKETA